MSHVELIDGLDVVIAERVMKPRVDTALDMLCDAARAKAPGVKVWVTMRDERVRTSHRKTDAQAVPANLRFRLPKAGRGDGDVSLSDIGNVDLARFPRDPNLPIANRINCRCEAPTVPHLLRESIKRTPVTLTGTRVAGSVETRFPRAAESEFGTTEDGGAYFMTNALREVATRLQSGQSR